MVSLCALTGNISHSDQILRLLNLPVAPINIYIVMKFQNYFTEWKMCIYSDTTLGTGADFSIASLVAPRLPTLPVKIYSDKF